MKISNLPEIIYSPLTKIIDNRTSLVISSPSAWKHVGKSINVNPVEVLYPTSTKKEDLEKLTQEIGKKYNNIKIVYGIGGGQAIDIAKYVATNMQVDSYAIPTVLSTDAFLADYVAMRENNCVTYPELKRPERVYLDYEFLSSLPTHLLSVGCGDTLAMATSIEDWKYAERKKKTTLEDAFSQENYNLSSSIVEYLLGYGDEIKSKSKIGVQAIVQALSLKVQLCSFLGHSRPEEGSEHFFVYNLENCVKHFLHGDGITLGVLIMLKLHGKDITRIKAFSDKVELNYRQFDQEGIIKTLQSLSDFSMQHDLAYSLANDIHLSDNEIKKLLKDCGIN